MTCYIVRFTSECQNGSRLSHLSVVAAASYFHARVIAMGGYKRARHTATQEHHINVNATVFHMVEGGI